MEVKNCKTCGRLFNYLGGPRICPACKEELEKKFQVVKDYIRDNPHSTMNDISKDNDVEVAQIQQWVREERLQFTADSPIKLSCENCGAPIRTGRFCEKCKREMANDLTNAFKRPEQPNPFAKKPRSESDRMRFLNNNA